MLIIITPTTAPPPADAVRVRDALVLTVNSGRVRDALPLRVVTGRPRMREPLYLAARTGDPTQYHPPIGGAGVVYHSGLPAEAISYTVRQGEGEKTPTLSAELLGRVPLSGSVRLGVRVDGYAQSYGPFGGVTLTYRLTPTGWITRAEAADFSAADAEADSPYMLPFEQEFLEWEIERDLSPRQQAEQAREQALREREWARLERQARAAGREFKRPDKEPDRRNTPVDAVIQFALSRLGIPFILGRPIPDLGRYWASEDTGFKVGAGELVGVSYKVKGRTPVQVIEDILGPLGWKVEIREGQAYIGPPAELKPEEETPGTLQVPSNYLTGVSQEIINPDPENANRALPRRIIFTGAAIRYELPPLPPELDEDGNLTDPSAFAQLRDGTLTLTSQAYGLDNLGKPRLEMYRTEALTKADGLLVREKMEEQGLQGPGGPFPMGWGMNEVRNTESYYEDDLYPQAETRKVTRARKYFWWLQAMHDSEETEVTQVWHAEGWLHQRTTVRTVITPTDVRSGGGGELFVYSHRETEVETETWIPTSPQLWYRKRTLSRRKWFSAVGENGDPEDPVRDWEMLVDTEVTDQAPPQAPDVDDEEKEDEEGEGFPYDEEITQTFETGGRGPVQEIRVPTALEIPDAWAKDNIAAKSRAQTMQRTTYDMAVPPSVTVGTRVKSYSVSGKAASVSASVTVEEQYG